MNTFQISSTVTGAILGTYQADSADDALEAMARDAGYPGYSVMCDSMDLDESEMRADVCVR